MNSSPDLLVGSHRVDCAAYPSDGVGVQSVRCCSQVWLAQRSSHCWARGTGWSRHSPDPYGRGSGDPAIITRCADRIGGIHIKGCFADYLAPESRKGLGYHEIGATKRLWAEPGRAVVVDFDAVVAAMPMDYDGDYMIENDEPSAESRYEPHKMSFDWARRALSFVLMQRRRNS
jgi:hypothetical protein